MNTRSRSAGSIIASCIDYGDEASWWAGVNIDPLPIALQLWRRSRSFVTETLETCARKGKDYARCF